jgi:hypothetical protein
MTKYLPDLILIQLQIKTHLDLTPSPLKKTFLGLQLTRQPEFMMTFFVFYSWMLTVKNRL